MAVRKSELRTEVVGHEAVVPVECRRARLSRRRSPWPRAPPDRDPRTSPRCARVSSATSAAVRSRPAASQQLARLRLVHPQLVRPDLDRQASRPQGSQRERAVAARRERQLRSLGNMPRERGDGVQARRVVEQMQVIEDQARPARPSSPAPPPDAGPPFLRPKRPAKPVPRTRSGRAARRGRARLRHTSAGRSGRCRFSSTDHPRERPLRARGPLSEQRRLPPTGPGGHDDQRGPCPGPLKRADERRACHVPGATRWCAELRLQQFESLVRMRLATTAQVPARSGARP